MICVHCRVSIRIKNANQVSAIELLCLEITEMSGELTYSDIAKGRIAKVWQGDSRLAEVGGLVGKGDRIVRIGSVARNITSNRNLIVSYLFWQDEGKRAWSLGDSLRVRGKGMRAAQIA